MAAQMNQRRENEKKFDESKALERAQEKKIQIWIMKSMKKKKKNGEGG